jgi:DNA-binding transcriptional regulator YiaG
MSSFQRVRALASKGVVSRPVEATRVGREGDGELARRPHGSATTTPSIREAIQASREKNTVLATRYGVNRKTVAKWKRRSFSSDLQMRPKNPRSLPLKNEVIIMALLQRRSQKMGGRG